MEHLYITRYTPVDDAVLNLIALLPTEFLPRVVEPAFFNKLQNKDFMRIATFLAIKSFKEGGCPIGAVIIGEGRQIIGKGHNTLIQENDSTMHGETSALRDAGRVAKLKGQEPVDFRQATMFTTLTPCEVCCAQVKNRANFDTIVIGDVTNAPSTGKNLRSGDGAIKNVIILEDPKAIAVYKMYEMQKNQIHLLDWRGYKAITPRL